MSKDKATIGRLEHTRIDLADAYQVAYWTEKFAVTAERLKAAVEVAGPQAADVERNLNMRKC